MKELTAAGYLSAEFALRQGLSISDQCYTGLDPSSGFPAVLYSSPYAAKHFRQKAKLWRPAKGVG